jgi:hypothetical protein
MDIRKFAVEETSVLALHDASDAPMVDETGAPVTVTLYGPGSKPYARAQAAQQNRMLDKLKRKGKSDLTADDKAREQAEFLAGCTKEFSPNLEYTNGGTEKLSGEALHRAVYADNSIGFIAEQVGKFLGEWGNFTKGSPKP